MILTYEGIKGSIVYNRKVGLWRGKLLNVPGTHVFDGKDMADVRAWFGRAAKGWLENHDFMTKWS